MSLITNNQVRGLKLFNYLPVPVQVKNNINILDLPPNILNLILSNIKNSYDYKNIRLVCKAFYYIFKNILVFSPTGRVLKKIYISEHKVYRIDKFSTIYFNLNSNFIHYLYKTSFIKHNKKHSLEVEYDYKKNVRKRINYYCGKRNGYCDEYSDKRLIKRTKYLDDLKQGTQFTYYNNYTISIERDFLLGMLTHYKKFHKNIIILDAYFKGASLYGKTIVYYDYDVSHTMGLNIKNLLEFKKSELHGKSFINQFDRILKLNYDQGFLNGVQTVFNIDNKLRFIGNYKRGKINGKYCLYNNYKCVEEGEYKNGYFDKYISIFNSNELSKSHFPLSKGVLHGTYIERINFMEIRIGYNYGTFAGKYSYTDITNGETVKLIIYNPNNFYYSKMRFGVEYIIFKKTFKKYFITVYNIVDGIKDGGKITYEIDNFVDYY